jgi:hypothetical protein
MAHAPAAHQPGKEESGVTKAGIAAALVLSLQGNANVHRQIFYRGKSEFLLQCLRTDVFGLSLDDYGWVWDKLAQTKPPDLHEYPNGTILDDKGFPVAPTADDVKNAEHMAKVIDEARSRVILG